MTEQSSDHDLLAGYLLDALDPSERARFARHLATCDRCRAEVSDLSETVADLASATRVTPPADLEDAIMAALDDRPATVEPLHRAERSRRRWLWPAAAAATFVLGAGIVAASGVLTGNDTATISAEAQHIIDIAGAPDAHFMPLDLDAGAAKIVVSDQMNMAAVMATDLPMPATGEEYHVWTVMSDGSMMPAASFAPDSHGSASVMLDTGVRDATGFMLTIDETGADHPDGRMLAEVRL